MFLKPCWINTSEFLLCVRDHKFYNHGFGILHMLNRDLHEELKITGE